MLVDLIEMTSLGPVSLIIEKQSVIVMGKLPVIEKLSHFTKLRSMQCRYKKCFSNKKKIISNKIMSQH